jgi:hypothetical protein
MDKKFYESKTVWAGIFGMVYSVYLLATTGTVDFQAVMSFVAGLGLIGLRDVLGNLAE